MRDGRRAVLGGLVVLMAACSSGTSKTSIGAATKSSVVTAPPDMNLAASGSPTTTEIATTSTTSTTAAPSKLDIVITAKGFTQLPPDSIGNSYVTYAVVVQNPNSASAPQPWVASGISLNITFKDAAGNVVASKSPRIDFVLPAENGAVGDDFQAKGVATMDVQAAVGTWTPNNSPITGAFTPSGVSTSADSYGSAKTVGSVKSTFAKDYKQLNAVAVFLNSAGTPIGGASTFLDFVPANGTASFSIDASSVPSGISNTSVYVFPSNLTDLGGS